MKSGCEVRRAEDVAVVRGRDADAAPAFTAASLFPSSSSTFAASLAVAGSRTAATTPATTPRWHRPRRGLHLPAPPSATTFCSALRSAEVMMTWSDEDMAL
ncbi:hypothetical protein EJB05_38451, partial [Eragrostis curvula]